jgi:CRP-like cAMP-binding protein
LRPKSVSAWVAQNAESKRPRRKVTAERRLVEIGVGSQILRTLGVSDMVLLTNAPPSRYVGLEAFGLHIVGPRYADALKDVETRLANWLVKRCPNAESSQPVTIELSMPKRMLAAELGTVSETLSRTLAKLRKQKILNVAGKKIVVLSPSKLDALLRRNLGEPIGSV